MYLSTAEQKVQQNAFNPKSDNSEVLIIRHLNGEYFKEWKFWFLQENALYQWNRQISGTCLKTIPSVCTSTDVASPDPLPPTPSDSSATNTSENTEEDADDPELSHEGDIQMYRGADKSLARPTSRCILFDGENISFDASLYTYSTNIPPIMIINRINETQNLLSL